jgi:hypothetical protein
MKTPENALRWWLDRFQAMASSSQNDILGFRGFLADFPQACRDALAQDPQVLAEWRNWLLQDGQTLIARHWVQDHYTRSWVLAWLDTWLYAAQLVFSQSSWASGGYPSHLPNEVQKYWQDNWQNKILADLPLPAKFFDDVVRFLVGGRPPARPVAWAVFPIVPQGLPDLTQAVLTRWELEKLGTADGPGQIFPDPAQVLIRPMKPDFLAAVSEAHRAAGPPGCLIRFRVNPVDPRDEAYLSAAALSGPSGSGALYVALRALGEGLVPEPGLAVSFAVQDWAAGAVGGLGLKARACARHGFRRLMVAEDFTPPADIDLEVVRVDSLDGAAAQALGLARRVQEYLGKLRDELDRTPWSDPTGSLIPVSRVAVEVRVLKKVVRPSGSDRGRLPEPRRYVDPELAPYYEAPGYVVDREEVAWADEMERVRRAVVLGAPGGGKSFLTRWAVLQLADRVQGALAQGQPLGETPLPVHIELPALARTPHSRAEDVIVQRLQELGAGQFAQGLVRLLKENDKAWLVLDALDQVPEDRWPAVEGWLRELEGWECRVVLTCRTARYTRDLIPWREVTEYELAPLDPDRVRALFERWFGADPGRDLWEKVKESPHLLDACRSPLVASIVCLVHQEQRVGPGVRRGDLYDQALRILIRQGWRRQNITGGNQELGWRVAILEEVAWQLFQSRPEANDFGQREVEQAMRTALRRLGYGRLKVDQLLAEFKAAGILHDEGWERGQARFSFLHRQFLEYLAGCALAQRAEKDWDRWRDLVDRKAWHPAWWEALVFMGWAMENPEPLLELLADRNRDDYFRHRLVLALRVLAERR